MSCPIHGSNGPPESPEDAFEGMISSLVTLYLVGRHLDPDEHGPDGVVVTVHAQHDDEHDILTLKIGIGQVANLIMTAEHDAQAAAERNGGA